MQNQQNHIRLPGMAQVFACLAIFLALAFSFTSVLDLPIQLALFIAWFVIMGLGIRLGHDYKSLEQAAIDVLSGYGIEAGRWPGRPGVWVGGRKIASCGLALRRWAFFPGR